jgi:hypothetical protein
LKVHAEGASSRCVPPPQRGRRTSGCS